MINLSGKSCCVLVDQTLLCCLTCVGDFSLYFSDAIVGISKKSRLLTARLFIEIHHRLEPLLWATSLRYDVVFVLSSEPLPLMFFC
jgi:hypothetical protein